MSFLRIILVLSLVFATCVLPTATFAAEAAADGRLNVDSIVRGDYVLTQVAGAEVLENGAVAVHEGLIVAVGPWAEIDARFRSGQLLAGTNRVLLPGLVNGHTHSSMTLFRGMVDDLDLMTWLNDYVFPMEGRFVDPEFVRVGSQLACWEMIRGGTTSFVDMYFYPEVIAQVTVDCGLRAVVAAPHIDFPSPGFDGWDDSFAAAIAFVEAWQGKNPRITPAFAPHAPYTVVPEHLRATAEKAAALNAPVSMHLAEAPSETEVIGQRYGTSPVQHVATTGLLDRPLVAAHMVQLSAQDIATVADKGVGVVHNPTSNLKLGAGIAPVTDLLNAGVAVGLGTDGAASNNDLDMWEELRLAALLHKVREQDPTAVPAAAALTMATRMGAAAVGLADQVGQLRVGMQADLIQVDIGKLHQQPLYDIKSHLVYVVDSQDVVTTMVAGQLLMRDRKVLTIDESALRDAVQQKRDAIRKALADSRS